MDNICYLEYNYLQTWTTLSLLNFPINMHYLTMTEVSTFSFFFLNLERLKKIQAFTGFEPLTSAILVQRATNWTNKPTGSRSLSWFVTKTWQDNDEVMNKWKSYMRTAGWIIIWKRIIAVIDATFAVARRNLKKKKLIFFHIIPILPCIIIIMWPL